MIRVGIVGIGQIAEDYISIFASGQIKNAKITALASRNETRVRDMIETYKLGEIHYFENLKQMLENKVIDALLITTPHTLHKEMATLAIKHGVHALVDKPLGITTEEVDALCDLETKHPELTLGVLFNRRTNDLYKQAKQIIESNELGELRRTHWQITNLYRTNAYYQSSDWRGSYKYEGGGVLMNQAIHQLDLLLWLTGLPQKVMAYSNVGFKRPTKTENDINVTLFYEKGVMGNFIASTHESPGTNRLEMSFSKGQIIIEDDTNMKVTRLKIDELEHAKQSAAYFEHVPKTVETLQIPQTLNKVEQKRTIQNFIDSIRQEAEILCSFKEGKDTVRVVNAAYLSTWMNQIIDLNFESVLYQKELEKRYE